MAEYIAANGNEGEISLWSSGSSMGYFYDGQASGYERGSDPEEMLFGDNTLRFWNTSDRLNSAYWRKVAVSHDAYQLFKKQSDGVSYRQFVEQALVAAGVREDIPVLEDEA